MDEKNKKNNKDHKKFSELSELVSGSLDEINERHDDNVNKLVIESSETEGIISAPKDGSLPDQNQDDAKEDLTGQALQPATAPQDQKPEVRNDLEPEGQDLPESGSPAGFGTMNVQVGDPEAEKIGQEVDDQIKDKGIFKAAEKKKAEAEIISTVEEKADRYKDTSIREEVKQKEMIVTPRNKKAVRTYRDFAIENAKSTGGSLANMIMAEREKDNEKRRKSAANPKNIFMSVLSILFVTLGMGGVVAAYFVVANKQEDIKEANSIIITPNPQITAEFSKEIYEPDVNFRKLTDGFSNDYEDTATPIGSIKQVYFTTSSGESLKYLINTNKFLEILRTRTPSALLRTFSEDFTLGIYSTVENSQFLLFKVSSYPTAVEGMLEWENEIVLDLDPVMKINQVDEVRKRFFEDIILFNKDTRAILDSEGNIAFAYSFIDRQTLLIFKDRNTLKEVVSRLQNTIRR